MQVEKKIRMGIINRAKNYTPEWTFHTENPDIGSLLAIVYERMLAGTAKKFSKIPQKNRIAFLNELDAGILPAVPSHGYVQFLLVNEEVEGSTVPAGMVLTANDDELPGGQVNFETCAEVYVTPAIISDFYQVCDRNDSIYQIYDRRNMEWNPYTLFSLDGVNLQKHEMYFSHEILFNVQTEAYITLTCFSQGNAALPSEYLNALADSANAVVEYYSKQGWIEFESLEVAEDGLVLHKGKMQPEFKRKEIEGKINFWIRLRILAFDVFSKMCLGGMHLSSWSKSVLPDTIFGTQEELNPYRCFPFGERLDLYQEVYFGSEEILSKRGAQITLSFNIEFMKIPLDTTEKQTVDWEWIMKRSDMKQDLEFDITIESVIWEYYNGSGWTRLFVDQSYSHVFSVMDGDGRQYRTLQFICPEDMEKSLVNAVETYYIRARIMKINNLYKLQGNYIVPFLENTSLRYCYLAEGIKPQDYIFGNNLEYRHCRGDSLEKEGISKPFFQTGMKEMALYIGFEIAPIGSPIKMLFCMENDRDCSGKPLCWEYWNGNRWRNSNPVDETDYFSRTGILTLEGNVDMEPRKLFGKERYWLRIQDIKNTYIDRGNEGNRPVLQQIYMNAVPVQNINRRQREYFQMEIYQENKVFHLLDRNIQEAKVFVDESGHLSAVEMEQLKNNKSVLTETEDDRFAERVWVEWSRVSDFSESGPMDRHFVIRSSDGELWFGNGKHGRIPYISKTENIFIDYCSGGGEHSNITEGKISRMSRSIGYISEVTNPVAMTGGCDGEKPEDAMRRMSGYIRHQNRAVSARDYEQLVMCAVRDIQMVKCFAGYDDAGKALSGAVTLVVLQKQFRQGKGSFAEVRERILRYIQDKISVSLLNNRKFFVVPPEFIEIRLHIELSVESFNQVFHVKQEVLERLDGFLAPAGGKDSKSGWEIGSFPNIVQIQNAINDIKGILSIRNIMMNTYAAAASGWKEVDAEKIKKHRYILPISGAHEIIVRI